MKDEEMRKKRKIKDLPINKPLAKNTTSDESQDFYKSYSDNKSNSEAIIQNLISNMSSNDQNISEEELELPEENGNALSKPEIFQGTIQYIKKYTGSDDEEIDVVNIDEDSSNNEIVLDTNPITVTKKSKLQHKKCSNKISSNPKIQNKTMKTALTVTEGMQKFFFPITKQSGNNSTRSKIISNVEELKAIENVLDSKVQNKANTIISEKKSNKKTFFEMYTMPVNKNKLTNCNSTSKENESVINFENNIDLNTNKKNNFAKHVNDQEFAKLCTAKVILDRVAADNYFKSKQLCGEKAIFNATVNINNKSNISPKPNNKKNLIQTTMLQFYNTKSLKDVIEKNENASNKTMHDSGVITAKVSTKAAKVLATTAPNKSFQTGKNSSSHSLSNSSLEDSETLDLKTSESLRDIKFFYCNDCNYKTKKGKSWILKHIQSKHSNEFGNGILECEQCDKKFKKRHNLKLHQFTCGLIPHLKCPFCPLRTKYLKSIKRHIIKQHKNKFKLNQLEDIFKKIASNGKAFKAKAVKLALKESKEISKFKKENKARRISEIGLYCINCNQSFDREYKKKMIRLKVCSTCDKALQHQCLKCKKTFKSYESCWNHRMYTCEEQIQQKLLQCNDCSFTALTKYKIQCHIERRHTQIDPKDYVKCPNCSKEFKNLAYMRCHKLYCGKSKDDHQCKICSFKTKYIYQYNKHIRQHAKHSENKCTSSNNSNSNINISGELINSRIESGSAIASKIERNEYQRVQVIAPNSIKEENLQEKTSKMLKLATYLCLKCKAVDPLTTVKVINCSKCKIKMHYNCKSCNRVYGLWGSFCQHLAQMCATARNYQCEHCNRQFTIKDNVRRHIFAEHMTKIDSKGYVKCPKCKKKYKGRANMLKHERRCGKVLYFKCKLCYVKCTYKHNLRKHMLRQHKTLSRTEIENALNEANKKLKKKEGVKKNKILETKNSALSKNDLKIIPINKNGFQIISSLMTKQEIMNTRHLIEAKCLNCSKSYTTDKKKKNHLLEKCFYCQTKNIYRCVQCSKQYSRCRRARRHIKRDHLLDPKQHILHECSNCGKRFAFYENLKLHWGVCLKTNKSNLICDYCGYATKFKYNLTLHIKRKHLHATIKKD